MSRGHGRVERALLRHFETTEGASRDTAELCQLVYSTTNVTKAHRVAVLRAIKRLATGPLGHLGRRVILFERQSDEWFDASLGLPSNAALANEPRPARRR